MAFINPSELRGALFMLDLCTLFCSKILNTIDYKAWIFFLYKSDSSERRKSYTPKMAWGLVNPIFSFGWNIPLTTWEDFRTYWEFYIKAQHTSNPRLMHQSLYTGLRNFICKDASRMSLHKECFPCFVSWYVSHTVKGQMSNLTFMCHL